MHAARTIALDRHTRSATWHDWARRFGWTATLASAGLGAVALLGGTLWPFELACHLRAPLAVLAGLGGLAAIIARAKWGALTAALVLVWQLVGIVPWYWPANQPESQGPPLRIMALNVNSANRLHARAIHAIREARPDVVFVLEVNARWMKALAALRDEFPYVYAEPRESNFGMAVFSRRPWLEARTLDADGLPFLLLRLDHAGQAWTILGVHPLPPVRHDAWRRRDKQLDELAGQVPRAGPVVVIGDLNLTSWSPRFDSFLARTSLRDSRAGFGLQPTWPARVPLLRIPIDHALVSPQVAVVDRRVGPEIGSDHLPIVVDLQAAPTRRPPVESR